jgi:hypothetical protein
VFDSGKGQEFFFKLPRLNILPFQWVFGVVSSAVKQMEFGGNKYRHRKEDIIKINLRGWL